MTVDPNRFAGPSEAAILREHLADELADLERVNGRLERARRARNDAEVALRAAQEAADSARAVEAQGEAHATALHASIGRARGLLHPIRRVPDEILSQIFLEWLSSVKPGCLDDRSIRTVPFTASSICRRWRRVALNTQPLWTRASLDFLVVERDAEPWSHYVHTHYQRSGKSPLSVRITTWTYNDDEVPGSSVSLVWGTLTIMLRRCHALSVVCMNGIQDPRMKELLQGRAPMLESFELISYDPDLDIPPGTPVFDDLPCLKDLRLDGASIVWDKGRCFSRTTVLSLTGDHQPAMDAAQLVHIANRLPNLEHLIFQHSLTATPASPEVCFLALRQLEFTGTVSEAAAQRLRFPVLEEAFLSSMRSPKLLIGLALSRSTNLSKLHLARVCLSSGLAEAVALLGRLQELDATSCSVSDDFFRRLAQPHADGTWPCPLLRRLHVGAVVPKDRKTFDGAALIALVKARRTATGVVALRDVVATWAKDMDYSKAGFQDELQRLIS